MIIGRRKELARRLAAIEAKLDSLNPRLSTTPPGAMPASTAPELGRAHDQLPAGELHIEKQLDRIEEILQLLFDREPEMRERLGRLRGEAEYEQAFDEEEPLVSIVIPTYDRGELLVTRAIPSVFAQSYENIEVVVFGDSAPEDTGRKLVELDDPRITYQNLSYRGPYPQDPRDLWHVAGIPPRNAAVATARGRWIAPLDDDDAFHPHHIESLIQLAKRERNEVAYGLLRCLMIDGSEFSLGMYPPEIGHFGWQSAIFHAGLRFFEMELADALFFSPADWSLCRRMLRAGVRFGMLNEVVTDHYESRLAPKFDRQDD